MEAITKFFNTHIVSFAWSTIFIAVVIIITVIAARLTFHVFKKVRANMQAKSSPYITYLGFLKYLSVGAIYFTGVLVILYNIPSLEKAVTSLLTGSGIAAVVIGFASQEAMSNLAGGMMILVFKPFVLGDFIRFVGQDIIGVVEEITLRHTVVRTVENKRIMIPNGLINGEIIENANYTDDKTCALIDIGISYSANIDKAMEIMVLEARKHPSFIDNRSDEDKEKGTPDIIVRVIALGDSSVNIRAMVWANSNAEAFAMKCDLLKSIKEHFDRENIEIPFPHVTVIQGK